MLGIGLLITLLMIAISVITVFAKFRNQNCEQYFNSGSPLFRFDNKLNKNIENTSLKIFKMLFIFLIIITISLVGVPFYLLAFSLTSMYIFFDLLYKFFIYPLTSVTPIFAKILKERGRLLTLIFCSLVILSIQKSVIFGHDTTSVVGIMSFVFGIIIIFNIYEILNPKKEKDDEATDNK